jgi:WD40 repeat protein
VATVLVVVSALAVVAFWFAAQTNRQASDLEAAATTDARRLIELGTSQAETELRRQETENARATAEAQSRIAVSKQLAAQAANHLANDLDVAALLSVQAFHLDDNLESRSSLFTVVTRNPVVGTVLRGHPHGEALGEAFALAFSPDGRLLASGSMDGTVIVWDAATGQIVTGPLGGRAAFSDVVSCVAFSPDGTTLASGSSLGRIYLWDLATGNATGPLQWESHQLQRLAFQQDGRVLAAQSRGGRTLLWDLAASPPASRPVGEPEFGAEGMAFSQPGGVFTLLLAYSPGTRKAWDVETGQSRGEATVPSAGTVLGLSPDGKTLAVTEPEGKFQLWSVASGQPIGQPIDAQTSEPDQIAFSPDGRWLVTAGKTQDIKVWDASSGQAIGEPVIPYAAAYHNTVAVSSDGKVAAAPVNKRPVLWDPASRLDFRPPEGCDLKGVVFAEGVTARAVCDCQGAIQIMDPATGQPVGAALATDPVVRVVFSRNREALALVGGDGMVQLWKPTGSESAPRTLADGLAAMLDDDQEVVVGLGVGPDRTTLALYNQSGRVFLWDLSGGTSEARLLEQSGERPWNGRMGDLAFSPDGQELAVGGWDATVRLWQVGDGRLLRVQEGYPDGVCGVAFGPDGASVAVSTCSGQVSLWSSVGGQHKGEWFGHNWWVDSLAFSRDGALLAASGAEGVLIWDLASGRPLVNSMIGANGSVVFNPDDRALVVTGKGRLTVLDMSSDAWLARACRITNHNLSQEEWNRFVGADVPYQCTCPDLPPGEGTSENACK